jgi:lysophospholipase L1-like esterase
MTYLTAVFVLFLLYGTYAMGRIIFFSRRAVAAGRRAIPVSHLVENARKRVLVIGDSTAYGTGAIDPHHSLAGRLVIDFPDIEVINASENAMSFKRLSKKIRGLEGPFDTAIIHIGGIDAILLTTENCIGKHVRIIKDELTRLGVQDIVLVSMNNVGSAPLIPFPINLLYELRSKHLFGFLSLLCEKLGIAHVPLFEPRSSDPFVQNPQLFSGDGIHPNDEGYAVWYGRIKEKIDNILNA